jgi:hypothetical protein
MDEASDFVRLELQIDVPAPEVFSAVIGNWISGIIGSVYPDRQSGGVANLNGLIHVLAQRLGGKTRTKRLNAANLQWAIDSVIAQHTAAIPLP